MTELKKILESHDQSHDHTYQVKLMKYGALLYSMQRSISSRQVLTVNSVSVPLGTPWTTDQCPVLQLISKSAEIKFKARSFCTNLSTTDEFLSNTEWHLPIWGRSRWDAVGVLRTSDAVQQTPSQIHKTTLIFNSKKHLKCKFWQISKQWSFFSSRYLAIVHGLWYKNLFSN